MTPSYLPAASILFLFIINSIYFKNPISLSFFFLITDQRNQIFSTQVNFLLAIPCQFASDLISLLYLNCIATIWVTPKFSQAYSYLPFYLRNKFVWLIS